MHIGMVMKIGSVGKPKLGGVRRSMLSGKHEVGLIMHGHLHTRENKCGKVLMARWLRGVG